MTSQGKSILTALLIDIKNGGVSPLMAVQAFALITRKARLPYEDFREINSLLRTEFGVSQQDWEKMMVEVLKSLNIAEMKTTD